MKLNSEDCLIAALTATVIIGVAAFLWLILEDILTEETYQKVTLDSGKQCLLIVKGSKVTDLDCEG